MPTESYPFAGAQDALNRMKRAYERGSGCRLTAREVAALGVTMIGQIWSEEDPRSKDRPHAD